MICPKKLKQAAGSVFSPIAKTLPLLLMGAKNGLHGRLRFIPSQDNAMKKIKITPIRRSVYQDLIAQYENPIEHACDEIIGKEYICENGEKPDGLCAEAWSCMERFAKELALGGGNFYDGWMKNEHSAMISCNDGFRPVSFLLEVIE